MDDWETADAAEDYLRQGGEDKKEPRFSPLEWLPHDWLIDNPPPQRPIAIQGILSVGDLAIITGGWDTFKSTFAAELAYSLASGDYLFGRFPVERRLRVGILQAEIDAGAYVERLKAFPHEPEMIVCSAGRFDFSHMQHLAQDVEDMALDAVILDPIGQMWPPRSLTGEPFSENNRLHVGPVLRALKTLRKTIVLVHHDPKPSQGLRNRASGSSALLNDPDTRIFLDRNDPLVSVTVRNRLQRPAGTFDVEFRDRRLHFRHFA